LVVRSSIDAMQYARGRVDVASPVVRAPSSRPSRISDVDSILHLQRTAGNAAVGSYLSIQRSREEDDARAARLLDMRTVGDWTGAATLLLAAEERWMVQQLHGFRADQLRYLDDAVRRMGVRNSRLRIFIHAGLEQQGATDDTADPAAGYGEIQGKVTQITHGKVQAGGNQSASLTFDVTFQPRSGAVNADLIEFIQMAKVVSTVGSTPDATGTPIPNDAAANGQNREDVDHARVDRATGRDYGWIGINDDGTVKPDRLRPWHPGDRSPAWMNDTPSRSVPNVRFDYETAAVCRQGRDQGMVYATVKWGFTIDATMRVIPDDPKYFNKESSEFDLAIIFWNSEAARSGSTQKPLPENLH
jgi:hypothetical protein